MDDINNYIFDFEGEIETLWDIFPKDSGLFLFIESKIAKSRDGNEVRIDSQKVISNQPVREEFLEAVRNYIKLNFECDSELSSFHTPLSNNVYSGHLISLRETDISTEIFGEEKRSLMRLFNLFHETGHSLIDMDDINARESAADAYTAICFFQRFGSDAKDFLSQTSWLRSFETLVGNTNHLTIPVLDKIIADSATRDFSKLSPEETMQLSKTYAEEWTPEASVLSIARPILTKHKSNVKIALFGDTCLSSSADNLSFYVGSKFLQPFLNPEGIVFNDRASRLTEDKRKVYAQIIKERAFGITLRDVFNPITAKPEKFLTAQTSLKTKFMKSSLKAEPPLTTYLKVALPAGQKHFTVNLKNTHFVRFV